MMLDKQTLMSSVNQCRLLRAAPRRNIPSIYLFIIFFVHLSIYSIYLFSYLCIYLCSFIYVFIYLCSFIYVSIYLFSFIYFLR